MNQPTHSSLPVDAQMLRDKDALLANYHKTRDISVRMTADLEVEDQVIQTCEDVSPTKWHLAHTTWFFETFILLQFDQSYTPFNDQFEYLFNSYYNAVGPQFYRPERGFLSRPTVTEVHCYRRHVDEHVERCIRQMYEADWLKAAAILETGIHHEQQHQELILTDIKEVLSHHPMHPAPFAGPPKREVQDASDLDWLSFEGGLTSIGRHIGEGEPFAYDNEGPLHQHMLTPFEIACRPITNGEFLGFVADGGYDSPLLWLSDGWAARQNHAWTHPHHWHCQDGEWFQYTLHGLKPLVKEEPVCHISYFEANAYANWCNARLPTEFEWEHASRGYASHDGNFFDCSKDPHTGKVRGPSPTVSAAAPQSLADPFGSVWEWTQSQYAPYPSYVAAQGALGEYNGKFMCNQFVLRGGSCATPYGHVRHTYRNFFPPNARWQFSGLRLARYV